MAKAGGGPRSRPAAVGLAVGLALSAGCGERLPPTPTAPEAPEVPEEVPESARYPVVSQCGGVTILAGTPRRIAETKHPTCGEQYAVDFLVEGGPAEAMLLDLFQTHRLRDWRPEVRGEVVRHTFTVRMAPGLKNFSRTSVPARAGLRAYEPIVVQTCPGGEGGGPVLACTNRSCGMYEDVLEVPPLEPEDLEVAFTVPPEYMNLQYIGEGETVRVPLTYRVYRPLTEEVTLRIGVGSPYLDTSLPFAYLDVEVSPAEIRLPAGWTRTETVSLGVRVTRFDAEGWYDWASGSDPPSFRLTLERTWDVFHCASVSQEWVNFRLKEPE